MRVGQAVNLRAQIIDTAIAILADVGYSHFSALRVARELRISQSHLTHYFPTRSDLLAEVATAISERYAERVEHWCQDGKADHQSSLRSFIDFAIDDAVSEPTRTLFPALWEAANDHESMAEALNQIYYQSQASFLRMMDIDPDHPASSELWALVRLLGTIIEGATAIYGRGGTDHPQVEELKKTAKQMLNPRFNEAIVAYHKAKE